MYRPQFPFPTPSGCDEQRCVYSFDKTNTPTLTGSLPALQNLSRIPLNLDKDADYFLRGISTLDTAGGLQFRLEDPNGHPLSDTDNVSQVRNYEFPQLYSSMDGAGIVTLDSDDWGIYCQQGSRLLLFLYNNSAVAFDLSTLVFNLHGVKRYPPKDCK